MSEQAIPNCRKCQYHEENRGIIAVRTKKGMLQPGKEYCQHLKVKNKSISARSKGAYEYPTWCPLSPGKTCIICGTLIHVEEGEYCKKHSRSHT